MTVHTSSTAVGVAAEPKSQYHGRFDKDDLPYMTLQRSRNDIQVQLTRSRTDSEAELSQESSSQLKRTVFLATSHQGFVSKHEHKACATSPHIPRFDPETWYDPVPGAVGGISVEWSKNAHCCIQPVHHVYRLGPKKHAQY